MFQILILIATICLIYFLSRFFSSRKLENRSNETEEMVKCSECGINLPKKEAVIVEGLWFCNKEHLN
tara:strand:+ start:8153 stop:8353 length:201 start_codon:yes stop_codon:yes gene_type:complete